MPEPRDGQRQGRVMDLEFLTTMKQRLGAGGVLTGEQISSRSCDPFIHSPADALVLLRPRSTDEVSFILREAHAANVSIVVHGGLTGVSGGAHTCGADVIVSLERMRAIQSVCPVTRTIIAEAGVTIAELQASAEAHGLLYPVDFGSRLGATVGGSLSTNAGGNRTLRWGMTRDRVLGLEAVLPNGEVISSMHKLVKNNTGYDLRHLFMGAEGTLGVITRAVLRMVPKPTSHEVAFLSLPDYDSVLDVLNAAEKLTALSAFELMYADFYEAVAQARPGQVPLDPGAACYLLIETMGYDSAADKELFEGFLHSIYDRGLANAIVLAQSDAQRAAFWGVRESVDAALKLLGPMRTFDVSLEVTDIDDYVQGIRKALEQRFDNPRMIVNGHIGDNNIHMGIGVGMDTQAHADVIDELVYLPLAQFHGSMSAEHGIGTIKRHYLHISRSAEEIGLMRLIKHAIDPRGILNSHVLFP